MIEQEQRVANIFHDPVEALKAQHDYGVVLCLFWKGGTECLDWLRHSHSTCGRALSRLVCLILSSDAIERIVSLE